MQRNKANNGNKNVNLTVNLCVLGLSIHPFSVTASPVLEA